MPKKPTKKKEIIGPDGKPYRKSAAWVRPDQLKILIVGEPKVGKSSLIAAFGLVCPDEFHPFFLPTQPGTEMLDVDQPVEDCPMCGGSAEGCGNCEKPPGPGRVRKIVSTYDEAKTWLSWALACPAPRFNPIVIDPIAPCYDLCLRRVQSEDKEGRHPADMPGGGGWYRATGYLQALIGPILHAQRSMVAIAHSYTHDVFKGKMTRTVTEPNISGKFGFYIGAIVDIELEITAAATTEPEVAERIATVTPGRSNRGGDRTKYLPPMFSLGLSPEEGAKAFLGYYYEL